MPQAVASALGVTEEVGRPVIEALIKLAAERRMLLILDNCEHLIDASAELARRLLQAGPHLKILTSSREPLRIAGETIYPVPALATPDGNATDHRRGGWRDSKRRDCSSTGPPRPSRRSA